MPAYYRWEKGFNSQMNLARELWYAAGGITPRNPTTMKYLLIAVGEGMVSRPLNLVHNDFIHAMRQENFYNAAMLYDALIQLTEAAIFMDEQINKNFRSKPIPHVWDLLLRPLHDATIRAYEMIVYEEYPPSRKGTHPTWWYDPHAPRPGKIMHPLGEITEEKIRNIRGRLWSFTRLTSWGTPVGSSPEIPQVKARVRYLIDTALINVEEAENAVRRGKFLGAAVAYTQAIFMLNLYHKYRKTLHGLADMREFEEIDVDTENVFMSHYSNIQDMIGMVIR